MSLITPSFVSVFVINKTQKEAKYLLLKRSAKYLKGTWQMVTGKIEENETAYEAAIREVKEETGIINLELFSADTVETIYMKSFDKITLIPVFIAFVEIFEVSLSISEHDAYEWVSLEEANDRLVWSEQKRVLKHINEIFIKKTPHELLKIK
jgi:dATP pyrophosphohydrolase